MLPVVLSLLLTVTPASETTPLPVRVEGPATIVLVLDKSERSNDGPWSRAVLDYRVDLGVAGQDGTRSARWRLNAVDGQSVTPETSPSPDLEFTVGEALNPLRLENLDEIVERLRSQMSERQGDTSVIEAIRALSPEAAAALFARDATMVALGQGTDLYLGEDHVYEQEGVLPFGGAPIAMTGVYRLESLDPQTRTARLTWSMQIDPKALASAVPAMIRGMMQASGEWKPDDAEMMAKAERLMESARMENSRQCSFVVSTVNGLAEKIDCTTRIVYSAGLESHVRESRLLATQTLMK